MAKVERKFKIGDKIRVISMPTQTRIVVGLRDVNKVDVRTPDGAVYQNMLEANYELYTTPAEDAIALLVKEGYTITPPKPKVKGQIVVYWDGLFSHIIDKKSYDAWGEGAKKTYPPIAIVDWTAGDGLNPKGELL